MIFSQDPKGTVQLSGEGTTKIRVGAPVPAYMMQFSSKKDLLTDEKSSDFYRTGKEIAIKSGASKEELKKTLTKLKEAKAQEKEALEKFYDDKISHLEAKLKAK
jgi:hypothetical protein